MNRNKLRENVMKLLYQADIHNNYDYDFFTKTFEVLKDVTPVNYQYFTSLVRSFIDYKSIIDQDISVNLKKWDLDRIGKVELAILRLAVTEMLYIDDIPLKVSVNEAVELAKIFTDDNSPKYINGVLASIIKNIEEN